MLRSAAGSIISGNILARTMTFVFDDIDLRDLRFAQSGNTFASLLPRTANPPVASERPAPVCPSRAPEAGAGCISDEAA